ncbi:16S rRNA (uracil(1498)-N(3))-methyltransferase [Kangiella sp. TOML190]|uniref:16S rRNA (uracil(1498)-N(3))-methyltransferase n=1 Tax=Kangiella sp. TOML190 TaxID=2931351 RepID=UPI00203E6F98|nr:16S rRNA (uracil(1498)-N(3))-methyltransferase [Kangiella sp. TOML190]
MRINRIYVNTALSIGENIVLDKAASNHVGKVLRLNLGAPLHLFNGDGYLYSATISSLDKNRVEVLVSDKQSSTNESPLKIHLFQGVSRGDKMDLTFQKGVELGIAKFTPIITERCGVKLDRKRWQKKHEHWHKVIISACEQSGRNIIPQLSSVQTWQEALEHFSSQSYFLDPHSDTSFRLLNKPDLAHEIQLWVGPEGGFSESEVAQIQDLKGTPVFLGPRILRTETAALAAVASINALWGDF